MDESIAIRELKRFVSDYALEKGLPEESVSEVKKETKVAVVGSGPAGLTCAYYLAKKGYPVTIFEALPVAGGMLAVGIPAYRLPKDLLEKEIETIKFLGVEIKTDCRVGRDISFQQLREEGYKAVFIAAGAHQDLQLAIPGEELEGVIPGATFLRKVNLGEKFDFTGRSVVVVGGGNVAIDAARTSLRLGAKEVQIIYRRQKSDMPALREEILEAEKEGIKIHCFVSPKAILGRRQSQRCGMPPHERRQFDQSGRRRPVPVEGRNLCWRRISLSPLSGKLWKRSGPLAHRSSGGTTSPGQSCRTNVEDIFAA